jgi:hypothetical protein
VERIFVEKKSAHFFGKNDIKKTEYNVPK